MRYDNGRRMCSWSQHKQGNYFLYTSGCLNLTKHQFENIHLMIDSPEIQPDRESKSATQLCEVTASINTCLCTNKLLCNNVSSVEPFTEYTIPIFTEVNFDEVAHFRYFLPDDPILESLQKAGPRDEYFLIKSVNHVSGTRVKYASGFVSLLLFGVLVF
uniref:CD36 family protein n=1 Tax=Bursaphelenchus xylophilus TaxID=6326 RepID=A0A1I7SMH2_BURXY